MCVNVICTPPRHLPPPGKALICTNDIVFCGMSWAPSPTAFDVVRTYIVVGTGGLLRFGHGSALTSHCDVIHSLAAASLPPRGRLLSAQMILFFCDGSKIYAYHFRCCSHTHCCRGRRPRRPKQTKNIFLTIPLLIS